MLEDIGGMLEVLFWFVGIIFYPISEHSFYTKAISKLYVAKFPPGLFKSKEFEQVDKEGNVKTRPISVVKPVRIKLCDSVFIYFKSIFCPRKIV